jgi:hypothetical protein
MTSMQSTLEAQIKTSGLIEGISNGQPLTLQAKKIAKWLGAWICQGDYQARLEEVNKSFNDTPSKNLFWARLGIQETASIKTAFDSLTETQSASLTQIHQSGASMFLGEESHHLEALSTVLGTVKGRSRSNTEPAKGHMLVELSRIYQEVYSTLSENPENFIVSSGGQKTLNPKKLQETLNQVLNDYADVFSAEFIKGTGENITQLTKDTKAYFVPLLRNNSHTGLIDFLLGDANYSHMTHEELTSPSPNEQDIKAAEGFIANYSQDGIREFSQVEVRAGIKDAYAKLSAEAKKILVSKAREAKNIQEIRAKDKLSISSILGKFNFSSICGSVALGLLGGMLFGNTKAALLLSGLVGLLGSSSAVDLVNGVKSALVAPPARNGSSSSRAPAKTTSSV